MKIDKSFLQSASLVLVCDALARGAAAASGLLAARWLSVDDYAYYTIAVRVLSAISRITQGGVLVGFTALLGRTWPDMRRAGDIVASARAVRFIVSAATLPLLLLVAWILLREAGADIAIAATVVGLLGVFWWADFRTSVVDHLLFFAHQTTRVQLLDAALSLARLAGVVALYATGLLSVVPAIALAVAVSVVRVRPIERWIERLAPGERASIRPEDRREIAAASKRQLPVDIYLSLQDALVLAAIAVWGTPAAIAGYGAITRIIQLTTPFEALVRTHFWPKFATAKENVFGLYLKIVMVAAAPSFGLIAVAAVAPWSLLWLVGPNYAHLSEEMLIAAIILGAASFARTSWGVLASRGLNYFAWVQIPAGLGFMACAAAFVDVGTVLGALILSAGVAVGQIASVLAEAIAARRRGAL